MSDGKLPVIRKGTYRHNKSGKLYKVLGIAKATESEETLVIYRPLYDHELGYELFARPYDVFIEDVMLNGVSKPRFEFVED